MLAGRWGRSHQGLLFGPAESPDVDRGALRDGRHRLEALLLASQVSPGIEIEFLVTVEDTSGEVNFSGIDYGRTRTTSNLLEINGHTHYVQLGAITRRALTWEAGRFFSHSWFPTKLEVLERVEKQPVLKDHARYAHSWQGRALAQLIPPAAAGFCRWLFSEIDPDDCEQFMRHLREGADLPYHSPVYTLRERLRDGELSYGKRYVNRGPEIRIALTIMAWNKYRGGVEKVVKYQLPNPLSDDSFPRPV